MNQPQPPHNTDLVWFKACLQNATLVEKIKQIKLIVTDVDGAITDGLMFFSQTKDEGRFFCIQDGYIIKQAINAGFMIAFASGHANGSTHTRSRTLGIPENLCIVDKLDKAVVIKNFMDNYSLQQHQILLFGDDYPEAEAKQLLNKLLFVCPANTPFYLQHIADSCLPRTGGNNAFRLLMDLVLYINHKHVAQDLITSALSV